MRAGRARGPCRPLPPAASLGQCPAQLRPGIGTGGAARLVQLGGEHGGWAGRAFLLACRNPPDTLPTGASAAQHLQPQPRFPSPGAAFGSPGSGSSAACSWHGDEPTPLCCLPIAHPARCRAWAWCSWCCAALRSGTAPNNCSLLSSAEQSRSGAAGAKPASGSAQRATQPSQHGAEALKPGHGLNLEWGLCGC